MRRINYKSDIPPLLLSLKVDENQITVPDCDFIVRFYIEGYEGRHYDCSHIGGVWSNCEPSEDGTKLVCYINNQRLGIGELCAEFHYIRPDMRYSDGSQKSVVFIGSAELGVELVEDNGDAVTEAAIDVTLPFIYRTAYEIARDHGYTGTADDFYSALASVVGIADAEKKRVTAEISRNANEQERIENEENRLNAENGRVNAEAQRVRNEAIRGDAESDRVEQEEDRKAKFEEITEFIATVRANEGNRESNERERQTNEDTRMTEEAKRVEAEKKRAAEFEQQKLDLAGKIDRSGDEMGGDLIFTDNAGVSFSTSDGGAHTMFNDTDDVAKFTADNGDTFEFKQNETPNKDSSAVVVSANLYDALDMTLESMGSALDGDAAYRAEAGDKIFNPETCKIQRYNSTVGGFEDLCDPIEGKLYANKMTGYIYRWDTKTKKMVFVGGVKAYTKDEADSRFAKLDDATQRVNVKELNANNFVSAKSMWIGDEGLILGGDGNGHLTVEQDEVITDVTLNEKLATKADDVAYGVEWNNGQPTGEIQETTVKEATKNTTVATLFLGQSFNELEKEVEKKVDKTDVVQSTGTSETEVMSQNAVSDAIAVEKTRAKEAEENLDNKVTDLDKRTKVNQKETALSYTLYEHNGSVNWYVLTSSGAFDNSSLMNVAIIDVSSIRGKKISINSAISANSVIGYKWVKADGTETVLSASEKSEGSSTPVTVDLLVPADANTLYFSFYFSLPFSAIVLGEGENIDVAFEKLSSSVDKNKQQIELINDKIGNEDIDAGDNDNITKAVNAAFKASNIVDTKQTETEVMGTITSGWVNGTTGEIEYDTALWNILTIDVSEYNGCIIKMKPEDTHPVIGWKIVNASDNTLSNGLCGIFEINIPNSANKLIYSTRKAQGYNGGTVIKNEKVTKTAITIANDALATAEKALDKIPSTIIENGSVSTFANSLSNSKIEITDCPKYIKKRCSVTLDADISTVGEIKFGVGYDTARGCEVSITSNKIVVKNNAIGNVISETLSFSIESFVRATFIHDYDKVKIIICTKTNTFIKEVTSTSKYVKEIYGYPFVYATNGSSLSKVRLRYTSKEFGFDTWVFGDSYTSISDDRWTMKVIEDYGYNNWMLCGLAGGESLELYNNLVSALKFGTPKYIVWMLGMNDHDSNGVANESWVSCFNNIKEICKKRHITLILNTVPNVSTYDNTPKNTIIKNSGYRYIDSARSVGGDVFTQGVNNWYEGFLEDKSPYIHTSPLGASAQASQVIADFPEIMQ